MRHRASPSLINPWRRLRRATARSLGRLAELTGVRLLATVIVALTLATGACVLAAHVGGVSTTGDAEMAAVGDRGSQTELGDGGPSKSTPTHTSAPAQSQASQAPDRTTPTASPLRSKSDQGTRSPGTETATPSASPSPQPSMTASTSAEDHRPPHTSLSRDFPTSDSALFSFTASEPASFTCSLDGATYTPCESPTSYSDLNPGWHTFAVSATDAAGNVEPNRVEVRWRAGHPRSAEH